jgi:ABC-type sugar transport system ATPase subunit
MILIENLVKSYGNVKAIQGIRFSFDVKEIVAIVGPSGCGKTTLLRLITGLELPDEGTITIDGVDVSTPNHSVAPDKRGLSMIFQDLALWPHMTVQKHITFVLKNQKLDANTMQSKTDLILSNLNLAGYNNRYPHELSGGEKQRLAIGRAIAADARYLLMDEPFSNLDPILTEELQNLVLRLKETLQTGILYITHQVEDAFAIADRIAVMNQGRFEQIDEKAILRRAPKNDFVSRFLKRRSSLDDRVYL